MLFSRFFYLILAFAFGAAISIGFVAQNYYNRNTDRWMKDALAADSSAVGWYLKDDARNRSAALLPIALNPEVREGLAKASEADEMPKDAASKVTNALTKLANDSDPKFTALWAVDADGRVVASVGWQHKPGWNIGGFAVVADALAGWIRDDAWVLQERLYRVVARPVERDGGGEPIGAIVGLSAVDDQFAEAVTKRTGAAVAFYAMKTRVATGAPESFNRADLDVIQSDLPAALAEQEYVEKGRSKVRRPKDDLGIVYGRMSGEASELDSGYAVGRSVTLLKSPLAFLEKGEKQDFDTVPKGLLIGGMLGLGILGILFSVFEHTMPLGTFRKEAARLAKGEVDQLAPSRFRGAYKKIAADINDGIDKVAAKGGVPRRAADLEQVIGPLPAQPQMSAFAVPDAAPSSAGERKLPQPPERKLPQPPGSKSSNEEPPESDGVPSPKASGAGRPGPPPPPRPKPSGANMPAVAGPESDGPFDEMADWKKVYEEYLTVRRRCGEPTDSLTFDKFKATLERNKAALVERHNCTRVKFTVYEKDGKAALKASPLK
jgi:hypothetical protein